MNRSGIVPPHPTPCLKEQGKHDTPQEQIHTCVLVLGNSIEPTVQAPIKHLLKTNLVHCCYCTLTSAMCINNKRKKK